jgi:hypothetical protein
LTAWISTTGGRSFTQLGSATDSTWASGRPGLRAWGNLAYFDAVKVIQGQP